MCGECFNGFHSLNTTIFKSKVFRCSAWIIPNVSLKTDCIGCNAISKTLCNKKNRVQNQRAY